MRTAAGCLISILAATMLFGLNGGSALANHVQCGDVITQDTTLDADLINCPSSAITIGADNITLDLAGFSVRSAPCCAGTTGIADEGHRGVRVENGRVHAEVGIRLSNARDTELRDLDLAGSPALEAVHSNETRLETSNLIGGIPAVRWVDSDNGAIIDSTVRGYEEAVIMEFGSDHNRVEGSSFTSHASGGITIRDSSHNRITGNSFGNAWFGLALRDATDNEVVANAVHVENYGITVSRSHRNRIDRNSVSYGRYCKLCLVDSNFNLIRGNQSGIRITSGAGNALLRNTANDNQDDYFEDGFFGADGILVTEKASETLLKGNYATRNADDGFDVRNPSSQLIHNTGSFNGDLGIEAVAGIRDIANRAFGNENLLQCLNVVCRTREKPEK